MLNNILMKFRKSEDGGVVIIVTFSILVLFVAAAIAFDMSRTQMAKVKLASCLDTAGVAALAQIENVPSGTTINQWVVQNVKKYFLADCQSGYLETASVSFTDVSGNPNPSNTPNNVNISLSVPDDNTLTLNAFVAEKTMLMPIIGVDTVTISALTVVNRQTAGMELALVLDNTGSMGQSVQGGTVGTGNPAKINALKCALYGDAVAPSAGFCEANNLVTAGLLNILYGNATTASNLFVAMTTFSDMVNIGANVSGSAAQTFATALPKSYPPASYSGQTACVDARDATVPSRIDSDISPQDGTTLTMDISDDPPPVSATDPANFIILPATYDDGIGRDSAVAINSYCPNSFHALTSDLTQIIPQIKQMSYGGNTEIQLGFAWGWRLLSPNWQGQWGALPNYNPPNSQPAMTLPLKYNTSGMSKVVILMTDGENTVPSHGDIVGMRNTSAAADLNNGYEFQISGYPSSVSQLDARTEAVCDAMKQRGIIIYTIGFGPADGVNVTLLQHCATADAVNPHFFLAPDNTTLGKAFQQIGGQLSNLLITQ